MRQSCWRAYELTYIDHYEMNTITVQSSARTLLPNDVSMFKANNI